MTTQADALMAAPEPFRRWRFEWILPTLIRPRQAFERIFADPAGTWLTPLLLLSLAAVLHVVVAAPLRQAASLGDGVSPPPGMVYFTPEQQAQLDQAMSAASGPSFTYVLPAGLSVVRIWLGWLILGSGLHLALTLSGSRGTAASVLTLVAWASLPLALREGVRIVYMLVTDQLILQPGLSGLAVGLTGAGGLYLTELLKGVDAFWLWHIGLLLFGVRANGDVSSTKARTSVLLVSVIALALSALPGFGLARLAGLTIIRPFLF